MAYLLKILIFWMLKFLSTCLIILGKWKKVASWDMLSSIQASEKTNMFSPTQQQWKLLLIRQFIQVTSFTFIWLGFGAFLAQVLGFFWKILPTLDSVLVAHQYLSFLGSSPSIII